MQVEEGEGEGEQGKGGEVRWGEEDVTVTRGEGNDRSGPEGGLGRDGTLWGRNHPFHHELDPFPPRMIGWLCAQPPAASHCCHRYRWWHRRHLIT